MDCAIRSITRPAWNPDPRRAAVEVLWNPDVRCVARRGYG